MIGGSASKNEGQAVDKIIHHRFNLEQSDKNSYFFSPKGNKVCSRLKIYTFLVKRNEFLVKGKILTKKNILFNVLEKIEISIF